MPILPEGYLSVVLAFAPVFSRRVWQHVQVLLAGAILTRGKRTVTAVLSVMGHRDDPHFQSYHRVLNRAIWSGLEVSRILLHLLVSTFPGDGPIVFGLDDTIERRRGAKIAAKGIYRDPVRSSSSHTVKASGLRWLSLVLLVPVPFARRVWALPFLTVLAPSERYFQGRGRAHKKLTDWARQMLIQLRRWLPMRDLVVAADSSFAVLELLKQMQQLAQPICMVCRFRLDAALYEPAPARLPKRSGRPRLKGKRLPTLEQLLQAQGQLWQAVTLPDWYGESRRAVELLSGTAVWYHPGKAPLPIRWVLIRDPLGKFRSQALLCTQLGSEPLQVLQWFTRRWQLEVTFAEVRAHLGVETQRQWSDLAIARTTPCLLGLFSLVTLLAHKSSRNGSLPVQQSAWYAKQLPTFSDALQAVRREFWQQLGFRLSLPEGDIGKLPKPLLEYFTDALCYAA
jgi:DDE superfamily endonuclease